MKEAFNGQEQPNGSPDHDNKQAPQQPECEPYRGGGKRYFSRGGVRLALLGLLAKEPMHGYQMMKALEEESGGLYVPSAGSIYPTLQAMEDSGLIGSQEEDGKKIYRLTDEGRIAVRLLPPRKERPDRQITDGEREAYKREKWKRKLEIGDDAYFIVRQLTAAERLAEGKPEERERLTRLLTDIGGQLSEFLGTNDTGGFAKDGGTADESGAVDDSKGADDSDTAAGSGNADGTDRSSDPAKGE